MAWDRDFLSVFSTDVEMILIKSKSAQTQYSVLHGCGDNPIDWELLYSECYVFSTCVDMILAFCKLVLHAFSVFHMRGGDPIPSVYFRVNIKYSPHMWRWSYGYTSYGRIVSAFSTVLEL